jgi:hypothetical protein
MLTHGNVLCVKRRGIKQILDDRPTNKLTMLLQSFLSKQSRQAKISMLIIQGEKDVQVPKEAERNKEDAQ